MTGRARILAISATALVACGSTEDPEPTWRVLERGLETRRFTSCGTGETITVARFSPEHFDLDVLAVSAGDGTSAALPVWAERNDLAAVSNAGMFHEDLRRHVGYLAIGDHVNNPVPVRDYRSALAIGPRDAGDPPFRLFDLDDTTTVEDVGEDYTTVVQNLRILARDGRNVWKDERPIWGIAAFAEDRSGRGLFVMSAGRRSVKELGDCLRSLPLEIVAAQYLEGGPEAALHLTTGGEQVSVGAAGGGAASIPLPLPNVLGLKRR